jgi:hypothetical protein
MPDARAVDHRLMDAVGTGNNGLRWPTTQNLVSPLVARITYQVLMARVPHWRPESSESKQISPQVIVSRRA